MVRDIGTRTIRAQVQTSTHIVLTTLARAENDDVPTFAAGVLDGYGAAVAGYRRRFAEVVGEETDLPENLDQALTDLRELREAGAALNSLWYSRELRVEELIRRIDQLQMLCSERSMSLAEAVP